MSENNIPPDELREHSHTFVNCYHHKRNSYGDHPQCKNNSIKNLHRICTYCGEEPSKKFGRGVALSGKAYTISDSEIIDSDEGVE